MLYSDIGGVLGTNGWDSAVRSSVCRAFQLDEKEIDVRHHLVFDSYERGFLTFDEYLSRVIFFTPRPFSPEEIRQFTYALSTPWIESIEFFQNLRRTNHLGFAIISNEGEGITEHRLRKFGLREICDFMLISHFTGLRKPDPEIWRLALNLAQAEASESIYVDDREIFVDAARDLGFTAIHHTSLETTQERFADLGLHQRL